MLNRGCHSFTLYVTRGYAEIRGIFSRAAPRAQDQPSSLRQKHSELKFSLKPKMLPLASPPPSAPWAANVLLRRCHAKRQPGPRQTRCSLCAAAAEELRGPTGMTGKAFFFYSTSGNGARGSTGWGCGAREPQGVCGGRGAGRCCACRGHDSPSAGGTAAAQPRHFEADRKQAERERFVFLDRNTVKLNSFHLNRVCPQATANDLHSCARPLKQAQNVSTRNMKRFVVASGGGGEGVPAGWSLSRMESQRDGVPAGSSGAGRSWGKGSGEASSASRLPLQG